MNAEGTKITGMVAVRKETLTMNITPEMEELMTRTMEQYFAAYWEKHATPEQEAKRKAEGKTFKGAYEFVRSIVEKYRNKPNGGSNCVAMPDDLAYWCLMEYMEHETEGAKYRTPEEIEAALKRTAARINYLLERAKKRLAWRVGDLSVIIPHTQEEFTAEGHAMRNCIGGYYRRQADGSTFCFFIRKNGEPHADVEMSLNGRIKQCYTAGNKNVPLSTRRYANRMARYFAKQMKHAA